MDLLGGPTVIDKNRQRARHLRSQILKYSLNPQAGFEYPADGNRAAPARAVIAQFGARGRVGPGELIIPRDFNPPFAPAAPAAPGHLERQRVQELVGKYHAAIRMFDARDFLDESCPRAFQLGVAPALGSDFDPGPFQPGSPGQFARHLENC